MYFVLFQEVTSKKLCGGKKNKKEIGVTCLLSVRLPEPQKPHVKPPEDIVRSNHYDPEEDEEYYRKQLSYFDRRSFETKPAAHVAASHLSEPAKPVHAQNQPNFSTYSSK